MGLKVTQRRQRRNINAADAARAYMRLLRHPSNTAIDAYLSRFSSPAGGDYVLVAEDYDIARYLLTVIHCAYVPQAPQVFLDTLGLKLNNAVDDYRLALARLEKRLLDKTVTFETEVKAPAMTAKPAPASTLGPDVVTRHDRDAKGAERVRII